MGPGGALNTGANGCCIGGDDRGERWLTLKCQRRATRVELLMQ
jgi:hypothetical protein